MSFENFHVHNSSPCIAITDNFITQTYYIDADTYSVFVHITRITRRSIADIFKTDLLKMYFY